MPQGAPPGAFDAAASCRGAVAAVPTTAPAASRTVARRIGAADDDCAFATVASQCTTAAAAPTPAVGRPTARDATPETLACTHAESGAMCSGDAATR